MRCTKPSDRRLTLSFFIGVLAGVFGAIVKWGWEVPFPPRNPNIFWPPGAIERVTPPKVFLESLHLPTNWEYVFSGVHLPLSIFIVHVGFSVFFGVLYCMLAEIWPKVTLWQGVLFAIAVDVVFHVILMPAIGEVPPLSQMPLDEHISEIFGHIVWVWAMEVVRRDIRNRVTHLPDPSDVPLS